MGIVIRLIVLAAICVGGWYIIHRQKVNNAKPSIKGGSLARKHAGFAKLFPPKDHR